MNINLSNFITFNFACIFLYFLSVIISIYFLVLVVVPRVKDVETSPEPEKKKILPTFFGGIVRYKSAVEYAKQFNLLLEDPNETYETFAKSVYSIGRINAFKHKYLKYGIIWFVIAIAMEFTIIVSLYVNLLIVSIGR